MDPGPEEKKVCDVLSELGLAWERHEHPPVFTVEQAELHWTDLRGLHLKNLFLRNDRGRHHYLVILEASKKVNLRALAKLLGEDRFSFASAERLKKYLGVDPGSVSAFNLINDREHAVTVVVDEDLQGADWVSFHPNVNTSTLTLSWSDFAKFLAWTGHKVISLKLEFDVVPEEAR